MKNILNISQNQEHKAIIIAMRKSWISDYNFEPKNTGFNLS